MSKSTERKKGIIYMIVNIISKRMYIGATTKPLNIRVREHKLIADRGEQLGNKLYDDIRYYGWENFEYKVIEHLIGTEAERHQREKYWIKEYNTFLNGLNSTEGDRGLAGYKQSDVTKRRKGEKHRGKTSVITNEVAAQIKEELASDCTMVDVSKKYGINYTTVREIKLLHKWYYV